MIQSITNEEKGLVTLLPGYKHGFEDGDKVEIKEVKAMKLLEKPEESINGSIHEVKVVNP